MRRFRTAQRAIALPRLTSFADGVVVYHYPVAPGDYTLSAALRVRVREEGEQGIRFQTLRAGPVTLHVE